MAEGGRIVREYRNMLLVDAIVVVVVVVVRLN